VSGTNSDQSSWWPWPGLVIVLLAVNASGMGVLLYASSRNGAPAAEPEAYERGLQADRRAVERAASDRLGWNVAAELENGVLRIRFSQASGEAVVVDSAWAETIHRSESGQWERVTLEREDSGAVSAVLTRWKPGSYEVRITAVRGSDRFVRSVVVGTGSRA